MAKIKILQIQGQSLIAFLKQKELRLVNPLPSDTKFIRAGHDNIGLLNYIIESKKFNNVKEGDCIPFYEPLLFEKVD